MIRRVSASDERFRTVDFGPHFNMVLAERTEGASGQDTRNGLGKSTLFEIVSFCLGSNITRGRGLAVDELAGWTFRVDLSHGGSDLSLSRQTDEARWIYVDSAHQDWSIQPTVSTGRARISVPKLRVELGRQLYGLTEDEEALRYGPTFRSLLSYQLRRGPDAFLDPLVHDRRQQPWDQQVNVSYQMKLNWNDAAEFQQVRADKKIIDSLATAMRQGSLPSYLGSEGELEAERVRLQDMISQRQQRLARFEVREDYEHIEREASALAEQIHDLVDENIRDRRRAELYRSRLTDEQSAVVTGGEVERLFEEAAVVLSDQIKRRLEDVKVFHDAVVANRTGYLSAEVGRLEAAVVAREAEITTLDRTKGEFMRVLESAGALEEYTRLQELTVEAEARLRDVEARISRGREVRDAKADWESRRSRVVQQARLRYDELRDVRDRAISLFNANTEALYGTPGRLIIDVTDSGFQFDVKIDRSDSLGVSRMKIFCFDLMLMQLWASTGGGPGFLVHDSALFDGVDERQVAAALSLAQSESERLDFQYLCALNTDDLPLNELGDGHPVSDHVALTLRDAEPSGMLLGVQF